MSATTIRTSTHSPAGSCAGLCTHAGLAAAHRDHRELLFGRARNLLGDAGLAEDAVQEVFVRAWRACATFDPARGGPPMRHWLQTILRNVVIDQVRARARRPRLVEADPSEAASAVASDAISQFMLRESILDALASISVEHRDAVVATLVRDRTYPQAAAELRIPVGTVKSRVFYGLRHLRELLEPAVAA